MILPELLISKLVLIFFEVDLSDLEGNVLDEDSKQFISGDKDFSQYSLIKFKNAKKDLTLNSLPDGTPGQMVLLLNTTIYSLMFKKWEKENNKSNGIYIVFDNDNQHILKKGCSCFVLFDDIFGDGKTWAWRLIF